MWAIIFRGTTTAIPLSIPQFNIVVGVFILSLDLVLRLADANYLASSIKTKAEFINGCQVDALQIPQIVAA